MAAPLEKATGGSVETRFYLHYLLYFLQFWLLLFVFYVKVFVLFFYIFSPVLDRCIYWQSRCSMTSWLLAETLQVAAE